MSAEPKTRKTPANRETFLFWAVYFFFLEFRNSSGFMHVGAVLRFSRKHTIHIRTNANHPLGRWTSPLRTIYFSRQWKVNMQQPPVSRDQRYTIYLELFGAKIARHIKTYYKYIQYIYGMYTLGCSNSPFYGVFFF